MKDTFEDHRTTYYYHDHGPPDFAKRYEERISDGRLLIDDKRAGLQIERIWAIAGWEGDSPDLLEVQGRQYLLTMFPFA
jgi:hypothetical protein